MCHHTLKCVVCERHLFFGCKKKLLWFFLHRKSIIFSCDPKLKPVSYDPILKKGVLIYGHKQKFNFLEK
jgi:hypothetical protein